MIRTLSCVVALVLLSSGSDAQTVQSLSLQPSNGRLAEEFEALSSIRELGDGRLLLTDRRQQRLVLANLTTGQVSAIGRRGQGPGEYGSPPQVFQLRADSSLLVARTQRRWLLLDGASIVATLPPDGAALRETRGVVIGTDTLGWILTTRTPPQQPGVTVTGKGDSLALLLVERATGRADTIARLRRMPSRSTLSVDAKGRETAASYDVIGIMETEEVATIFPDGAVAVARLDPFRIDWRLSNGTWVRGDSIGIIPVRLDARQKQWYMRVAAGNEPPKAPETVSGWPDVFPPFFPSALTLVPATDGRLLIRRPRDADHQGTRYLVVDRRGQPSGEITLAANQTILGFGRSHVFVTSTDNDGVQTIQRHPWPR
jgi:hypothetical protein